MASGNRKRTASMAKLSWMLAGTALASGCQSMMGITAKAAPLFRGGNCAASSAVPGETTSDPSRLEAIARSCEAAAGNTDSIRERTGLLYQAGTANMLLGEYYKARHSEPPLGLGLATAADQLDLVVRSTTYGGPVAPTKNSKADTSNIAGAARLALARTYKSQGRYPEAIATLEKMLAAAPTQPNAAAKLELARVYLERSRDGAVADGSLEKAVGYLDVFSGDLKYEDPALVAEGRSELIDRASQLGLAMMNAPQSRESSQRAIDALGKAETGAVAAGDSIPRAKVADIYVKLGQAKLRMAGLPTAGAPTVFDCNSKADSFWLGQAQISFTTALAKASDSAEANAGMGCARQAIAFQTGAPPTDAIPWFEQAVARAPSEKRYWLSYASALGASGRDATPAFNKALALAGDDPAQAAAIHVEIAKIYLSRGQTDLAMQSAHNALAADKNNGGAHLVLGKALYLNRDSGGSSVQAKREMDQAIELTRLRAEQKAVSADALYYRSLLEMEPANRAPRQSVRDAIDASNTLDKPEYKDQACLATVRFLDSTLIADGKIRCSVDDSPDASVFAKGALHEGMFYLATTHVSGIDKDKGREYALKSFDKGIARLGDGGPGEDPTTRSLRAKLTVGRAIAYSCVGLRDTGLGIMRSVDVSYQDEADRFFTQYDVKSCVR